MKAALHGNFFYIFDPFLVDYFNSLDSLKILQYLQSVQNAEKLLTYNLVFFFNVFPILLTLQQRKKACIALLIRQEQRYCLRSFL